LVIPPAPRIDGFEAACEMAELYWMALCRDVNFNNSMDDPLNDPPNNFSGNDFIGAAVNDIGTDPPDD
jgi:hypothetical protein